ncbi:MAG TPA: Hsp20/alpha crystallin family protein [Pyrinomonadaceae bacterium]|nr:Hsp20/alpha crystallin family protein [Pyrinomonadaceae bacterium]
MARSIEQYFRQLPMGGAQRPSERHWTPAADVYRTRDGWLVKVDLAGVSPDEIGITVAGRVLVIEGIRRDANCSETVSYHQIEITYSRFEKTLRFPCEIEGARVERAYRDGLLIIRLRGEAECDEGGQQSAAGSQPEKAGEAQG